eukprot:scaffold143056_cov31-Tisochrysis_lutea.AAC.2
MSRIPNCPLTWCIRQLLWPQPHFQCRHSCQKPKGITASPNRSSYEHPRQPFGQSSTRSASATLPPLLALRRSATIMWSPRHSALSHSTVGFGASTRAGWRPRLVFRKGWTKWDVRRSRRACPYGATTWTTMKKQLRRARNTGRRLTC